MGSAPSSAAFEPLPAILDFSTCRYKSPFTARPTLSTTAWLLSSSLCCCRLHSLVRCSGPCSKTFSFRQLAGLSISAHYLRHSPSMELSPDRASRSSEATNFTVVADHDTTSNARNGKIKKPPPITPRRFTRFFAPRPRNAQPTVRTSRAALRDISNASLNSRNKPLYQSYDPSQSENARPSKKRKLSFGSIVSSPVQSSPIKHVGYSLSSEERLENDEELDTIIDTDEEDADIDVLTDGEDEDTVHPKPKIVPYRSLSTSTNFLSMRLSSGRHMARREVPQSKAWQSETANFYSSSYDINRAPHRDALPFASASCNTNPLIAIADEEGEVRLVDSANSEAEDVKTETFNREFIAMKPHDNAIMDLDFSEDDLLLATASGDQTCQIIDVRTRTSIYCLTGHQSSIKRVQFQPNSGNNVLATCARDGSIRLWDVRCNQNDRPTYYVRGVDTNTMLQNAKFIQPKNSIALAHAAAFVPKSTTIRPVRPNLVPGRNEFSITSLSFLQGSRSHLLVTASETDAVVKLWDTRTAYSNKRSGLPVPLSCTLEPESHAFHRRFGVTSLAVSTDCSRIYTLCRDHTIYTYSTSHFILGNAPELSTTPTRPYRPSDGGQHGLGPIYAFRHPQLRVATFYPRLAIRKATDSQTELLAAASSEECVVLFPTNERYLTKSARIAPGDTSVPKQSWKAPSPLEARSSFDHQTSDNRSSTDTLPIYHHGTSLTRGHHKEVTSVSWTSEGNLITSSDDFTTRCWRENAANARTLRTKGEVNGQRWRAGYAELEEGYDEE